LAHWRGLHAPTKQVGRQVTKSGDNRMKCSKTMVPIGTQQTSQ